MNTLKLKIETYSPSEVKQKIKALSTFNYQVESVKFKGVAKNGKGNICYFDQNIYNVDSLNRKTFTLSEYDDDRFTPCHSPIPLESGDGDRPPEFLVFMKQTNSSDEITVCS